MTFAMPLSRFSAWDKARYATELLVSTAAGVLAAVHGSAGATQTALATLGSVSGVLLGALLTAMAILAAMPESPFIVNLRKTGKQADLVDDFFAAIALQFVGLLTLVPLVFLAATPPTWLAIAVGLTVVASFRTVFIAQRFRLILSVLNESA